MSSASDALTPPLPFARALLAAFAALGLLGCQPAIGDKCTLSTDCSIQGNRECDSSQPNGYCTVLACTADNCPDNASCVEFGATILGCPYNDYSAPSRTGQTMCVKGCASDSDCRQGDGYSCVDPTAPPWDAVVLDTSRSRKVCLFLASAAGGTVIPDADAAVCSPNRSGALDATLPTPAFDASEGGQPADATTAIDAAGSIEAGGDSSVESGPEAAVEASFEPEASFEAEAASEAEAPALDGAADAGDGAGGSAGSSDAAVDGADAGVVDAPVND